MSTTSWNHLNRRRLLQAGALGAGALVSGFAGTTLSTLAQGTPAAGTPSPAVFDPAVCYAPLNGSKPVQYKAVGDGPFKVALSNSYIGNVWRTQMMQMAQAFVKHEDIASRIASFQMNSSGTDDSAQIGAIEDMISQGAQAIVIDANTPGGQVNVLEQARADGIVIVAFDNTVDSDKIVQVNQDQVEMGRLWAQFLVDQTGGKGKILMVNGVPGTTVDTDRRKGAYAVFKAHPDIKYIEVDGEWDPGKAQSATATALASNSDIAGVWCQGGTNGAFQAFLDAGVPLVPFAGEAENGFRKQMLKYADKINCLSIGQTPAMVCVAIRMALDLLAGKEMPSFVSMPLPMATTAQLVPGVNVFPDAEDSFFTPIQVPGCGVDLTIQEIQAQKV
ncbi:MAG TPA: sugar ABC transporter substrate-binding protein [Thermomicrobiales bacterium]|nr:sugar ABC transporter substrate-binding protein [Thermomicrobiales bacterium]